MRKALALLALPLLALGATPAAAAEREDRKKKQTITRSQDQTSATGPPETGELSEQHAAMAMIGAFTASGDLPRLTTALNEGLNAGVTVNQVKEVLVQMYAYAGFPRSLNAIGTFMTVLEQREDKGIKEKTGPEPSPLPEGTDILELGTANQTELTGAPVTGPMFDFAPAIDEFLKTHLFGDIFSRDNLDWRSREMATIAALATLKGTESQLRSHFAIGLNTGLTEGQLRGLVQVLRNEVGSRQADSASRILDEVLRDR